MEDNVLQALKDKERLLLEDLKVTPQYKKWFAIKTAINVFEGKENEGIDIATKLTQTPEKIEYQKDFTWNEKVLYALSHLTSGFITDIVSELKKAEPGVDEKFLAVRVGATVSHLIRHNILQVIDKRGKRIRVAKK